MFEDDVYDLVNPDDQFYVVIAPGGWRIVDHENHERFKAVFTSKEHAQELCKALNGYESQVTDLKAKADIMQDGIYEGWGDDN